MSIFFVVGVLAIIGAVIFGRLGMLLDYLIGLSIAAALFALIVFLDIFARTVLHL